RWPARTAISISWRASSPGQCVDQHADIGKRLAAEDELGDAINLRVGHGSPGQFSELVDHVGFAGESLLASARRRDGLIMPRAVGQVNLDPRHVAKGSAARRDGGIV